jgi:glycosyltransferase involved in cell wall biosynthesis
LRILAIATNPETGASTRFRVLQWEPYLRAAGFSLTLDAFYSPDAASVLYRPGRYLSKLYYVLAGSLRRAVSLARAARNADILFIHREAFPLGQKILFKRLKSFSGPIVYDYDDAMFLPQRLGRGVLARIENLETPREVMALSAVVFAGNQFLADYARPHAKRVVVLPTCVDAGRFKPAEPAGRRDRCVVGWIGSHSTVKYLKSILPALERVADKHKFELYVVGGSTPLHAEGFPIVQVPWSLQREVVDFQRCDIGIYPLWNDPWTHGKCGFKGIQFMACGVPIVASLVGMNREIVEDGMNGFLASSEEDWVERLGLLLSDQALRQRFGEAGRRTVEERYSLLANAPRLVGSLQDAWNHRRRTA